MNNDTTAETAHNGNPESDGAVPTHRNPLGRRLRLVDALLTREFARVFEDDDVDRGDWMLLNALSGDVNAPEAIGGTERNPKHLSRLVKRGWVAWNDTGPQLTEKGRAARERIGSRVDGIRRRITDGVPAEDFDTTLATLDTIARILGWEEGMPVPGHGRGKRGRPRFAEWGGFPNGTAWRATARHAGHGERFTARPGFRDGFAPHRGRPHPHCREHHGRFGHI